MRHFLSCVAVVLLVACDNPTHAPLVQVPPQVLSSAASCGEGLCSVYTTVGYSYYEAGMCEGPEYSRSSSGGGTWDGVGKIGGMTRSGYVDFVRFPNDSACYYIGSQSATDLHMVYRGTPAPPCDERHDCESPIAGESYFADEACESTEFSVHNPPSQTSTWDGGGVVGLNRDYPTFRSMRTTSGCVAVEEFSMWARKVYRTNPTPLSLFISGPPHVKPNVLCWWSASASGGKLPYVQYHWVNVDSTSWPYGTPIHASISNSRWIYAVVTDYDGHVSGAQKYVLASPFAPNCPS